MTTMMVRSEEPGTRPNGRGGFNEVWGSDPQVIAVKRLLWAKATTRIDALSKSDLEGRTDDDIARMIVDQAIQFPEMGARSLSDPVEDDYHCDGSRYFIHRFVVSWPVMGDAELLAHWPWRSSDHKQLCDSEELREKRQRPEAEHRLGIPERDFVLKDSRVVSFVELFESDEGEPKQRRDQLLQERELEFPRYVRHLKLEEWSFRQGVPNGHKEVSRGVPS